MANVLIQFRVDEELKNQAVRLYDELGIDLPTAFRIFLKKSFVGGLPFDMKIKQRDYRSVDGWNLVSKLSNQASQSGVTDMTLEEINKEIQSARAEK